MLRRKLNRKGRIVVFIRADKKKKQNILARQYLSEDLKEVKERTTHLSGDERSRQGSGSGIAQGPEPRSIPGPVRDIGQTG